MAFAIAATLIMLVSSIGGVAKGATPSGSIGSSTLSTASGASSTTEFFPYVVDPSLYSTPSNVTSPGNYSLPQLASTMMGAQPVFYLLAVESGAANSSLVLFIGSYSPSEAQSGIPCEHHGGHNGCGKPCGEKGDGTSQWGTPGNGVQGCWYPPQIWNAFGTHFTNWEGTGCQGWGNGNGEGTGCPYCDPDDGFGQSQGGVSSGDSSTCAPMPPPTQPIVWSNPIVITTLPATITSDSLSVNGGIIVASISTSFDITDVFASQNGGQTWGLVASATGSQSRVATGNGYAVSASIGSILTATTIVLATNYTVSVSLGPALNATSMMFSDGTIGIVASCPNGTIQYYSSLDDGQSYSENLVGRFSFASTSSLFNAIGQTSLAAPGGIAGQVAATSEDDQVFVLYTSSVNGHAEAFTSSSPDNGSSWLGPYATSVGLGSIMDPRLVVSPVGYVYATWEENSVGTWRVDQAIYHIDGRTLQSPTPLPISSLDTSGTVTAPTLAVDGFERPAFVWTTLTPSGPILRFSSGYLSPSDSVATMELAVGQLSTSDFNSSVNATASQTYLEELLSELGNLTSNSTMTHSERMAAIEIVETQLYPSLTSIPLVLLCTQANITCRTGHGHDGKETGHGCRGEGNGVGTGWWGDPDDNGTGPAPPTGNVTNLIANFTGAFVANKYLAVYTDWLLESLGVGVLAPDPNDPTVSSNGNTVSVGSNPVNPITAVLQISLSFTSSTSTQGIRIYPCAGTVTTTSAPIYQWTNVTLTANSVSVGYGSFEQSFGGAGNETVYLTQLYPSTSYTWFVNVTAKYWVVTTTIETCTEHGQTKNIDITSKRYDSTASVGPVIGTTTPFRITAIPNPPVVQVADTATGEAPSLHWNTSAPVQTVTTIQPWDSSPISPINPTSDFLTEQDFLFPSTYSGTYNASALMTSQPGILPSCSNSCIGTISAGGPQTGTTQLSLSFQFYLISNFPNSPRGSVSTITSTSALVSFSVTYGPLGNLTGAVMLTENGQAAAGSFTAFLGGACGPYFNISLPNPMCKKPTATYKVSLVGLTPLSTYTVVVSVEETANGIVYTTMLTLQFSTPGVFQVYASDLPYDSITQEGGGENLQWDSLQYVHHSSSAQFVSGYISYYPTSNPSQPVNVPIMALSQVPNAPGEDELNLSVGLVPNTEYSIQMQLNYSTGGSTIGIASQPGSGFTYLQDTSGDGLADSEKVFGWYITYTNVYGQSNQIHTSAARQQLYATNGLVSDFVEKEFDLNPSMLDTAGSHMLDTWNLTFVVGTGSPTLPTSGFEYWYENSTNPFAASPAPGLSPPPNNAPIGSGWNNLTYTSGYSSSQTSGDNHPWSSEVLWSATALGQFEQLIQNDYASWLRAVTGTYDGERTLTVWGKLSWGANPLAMSTPGDGVPDGARLDPLYDLDLQVGAGSSGSGFYASMNGCPGGLLANMGYAVRLYVNASSYTGANEFKGLAGQGFVTCGSGATSTTSPAILTIPVSNTVQTQVVDFNAIVNTSTQGSGARSPGPFEKLTVAGCGQHYPLTVNMLNPQQNFNVEGSTSGCNTPPVALSGSVNAVPAGVKAPTYLWVPTDNSTLSKLPIGLQRYSGEQDFFLVVANVSTTPCTNCVYSSNPVPYPWGGTYTVTANHTEYSQMVNFLIPRGQFLASPMGQAILNNSPLLSVSSASNGISGESLPWQACYWQGHAVAKNGVDGSAGPTLCSNYQSYSWSAGTNPGTPSAVTTFADTSCSGSAANCAAGGVPSNPSLEAGYASPALQGIITLNLSAVSTTSDLNNLLAGLLDNSTVLPNGQLGVNGWLKPITNQLSSLGLNYVVMKALANTTQVNTGVYGMPISEATPPPPSCNALCSVWNTVSGVITTIAGAIVGLVWSVAVAAATYFDHIAQGMATFAETVAQASVNFLVNTVGKALETVLQQLIAFVINLIEKMLLSVISPLVLGLKTSVQGLQNTMNAWTQAVDSAYQANSVTSASLAGDEIMATALTLGAAMAILLQVGVGVATTVSLGAGLLIGILVTVIITALSDAGGSLSEPGGGPLSTVEGIVTASASTGFRAVVSLVEEAFNTTQAPLKSTDVKPFGDPPSNSGDPADLFGIFAAMLSEDAVVSSFITFGFASRTSTGGYGAAEAGMYLAFAALMFTLMEVLLALITPSPCNSSDVAEYDSLQLIDVAGEVFSAPGEGLSIFGAIQTKGPTQEASAITAILSAISFLMGAGSLGDLQSECAGA